MTENSTNNNRYDVIHAAAVAMGRRGGLKGGPARARALSAARRRQIARYAAAVRWGKMVAKG